MLGRAWCLGLLAACYSPPKPDCGFVCGPGDACPSDYHCAADGYCHADGSPASLSCGIDAGIDGRVIDALIADADTLPPMLIGSVPIPNATNVDVATTIQLTFSESVYYVDSASFRVSVSTTPVTGTIVNNLDRSVYTFTPDSALPTGSTIDVTLSSTIIDAAGNMLVPPYMFSFDTTP